MSKVKFRIAMSLDGYTAGPNQSVDQPLGEGGEELHDWMVKLRYFREIHGMEGGDTGPSDDIVREANANIGAEIMGRGKFGGGPGPWDESEPWNGWWGENPPFHMPVFVLTHHAREPLTMAGGTTFHFVTGGIESALSQAREAGGGKDILIGGGASTGQQYLAAGLVDEMELHVAPIILGGGDRLLEDVGDLKLEQIRAVAAPGVTHVKYRIAK